MKVRHLIDNLKQANESTRDLSRPPGPDCPDVRVVESYMNKTAAPPDRRGIESHFASCDRCTALSAAMVRRKRAERRSTSSRAGDLLSRGIGALFMIENSRAVRVGAYGLLVVAVAGALLVMNTRQAPTVIFYGLPHSEFKSAPDRAPHVEGIGSEESFCIGIRIDREYGRWIGILAEESGAPIDIVTAPIEADPPDFLVFPDSARGYPTRVAKVGSDILIDFRAADLLGFDAKNILCLSVFLKEPTGDESVRKLLADVEGAASGDSGWSGRALQSYIQRWGGDSIESISLERILYLGKS